MTLKHLKVIKIHSDVSNWWYIHLFKKYQYHIDIGDVGSVFTWYWIDIQSYSIAYRYCFSLLIFNGRKENPILCTSIMSLICLLVLVPPRTWPMRSYWLWARPSRWPISWLCRPRGPSSTRTPRRDWLQTWWRPDPANLCPDRVAAFGSQRWVGLRAAQNEENGNFSNAVFI